MKTSMIFAVLTSALIITGCGDGDSSSPTASSGDSSTVAQQSPAAPVTTPTANTPRADTSNAASTPGAADQSTLHVVQDAPIDPPSPAVSMSAGVTETIDPPGTSSPLAQTFAPTNDDTASVASEQLTPVVHYPPEPATSSSN
jgi:PBP1b-binding outer membrane lipoprotein LpoB